MVTNTATDDQPDLRHYLDALRRNWRVPPIAAIVLAALFAALPATSSPDRSTATVALVDESGIAAGLGLPKEMGTKYSSVGALLAMVRGDDVKQAVAAKLGYSPTVVITSEETP